MGQQKTEQVRARLTADQLEELEIMAYEQSEPGNIVSVSSVVRQAIVEYLENE